MEDAKVNPNISDGTNEPIFLPMSIYGNKEMIELYVKMGGNLNVVDFENRNALHLAAQNGRIETAKLLMHLGIDYKRKDVGNKTPLDLAREKNQTKIVEFLQEFEKK